MVTLIPIFTKELHQEGWGSPRPPYKDVTSRKHAKGLPQKYQNEDEPVPMLVLIPVHLGTGTFGVDGTYG